MRIRSSNHLIENLDDRYSRNDKYGLILLIIIIFLSLTLKICTTYLLNKAKKDFTENNTLSSYNKYFDFN